MKKIYTLYLLLMSTITFAQVGGVVTDPTSYTFYAEQVATGYETLNNGIQQLERAEEQLSVVKDNVHKLQQVKSYIRQAKLAKSILKNFEKSYDIINSLPALLDRIENRNVSSNLDDQALFLLEELDVIVEVTEMALTDGVLEMNDGQRTSMLLELYKSTKDFTQKLSDLNFRVQKSIR